MSTQSNSIILNLRESSNASCFGETNFTHRQELEKVKGLIDQRLKRLEDSSLGKDGIQQDAITILGSRGSGKTSFLKTLQQEVGRLNKDSICVLDIIDPTMIEQKGHVFLTIISQIRKVVNKQLDSDSCQVSCLRREWDDCLRELAAGLPTLDGISDGVSMDAWQDPEYIMNRGLEKVESAMKLASNFQKLVQRALKIIDKKAFVLMLDDIDIDFLIGWPVLETVRKYLIFPEIITVVSGDMRLFIKAIRKKQWKNFGKALLKNEGELLGHENSYNDLVTKMESQYLQKVLKPQLRHRLTTLLEKYQMDPKLSIEVENKELRVLYKEILNSYGIRNSVQLECYRSFLLNLPLRTQIQFLIKFIDIDFQEIHPRDVYDVFLSDLYEKEIDIDMAGSMPKYLYPIILKALVDSKKLNDVYQLQPITLDDSLNGCLMALTLLSSTHTQINPFLIFDYFVRVDYVRNIWSTLRYEEEHREESVREKLKKNRRTEMQTPSIEGLISHAGLYENRNLRDATCMMTAYLRAAINTQLGKESFIPYAGTVCLFGTADKAHGSTNKKEKRIDELEWIALIPASISQSNAKQGGLVTYSIYTLLGAIAELLQICQMRQNTEETNEAKEEHKQNLKKALAEMSQIRTFPMPGMMPYEGALLKNSGDIGGEKSTANNVDSKAVSDFAEKIQTWADQYPGKSISPHLLGKISTRAFYAMDSIDKDVSPKNLGEYMHQHLIAFMNAVLVEDVRENVGANLNLSNDNPRRNNKIFIENLKKVNGCNAPVDLYLSRWMLSCPLLLSYLQDDVELRDALTGFGIKDADLYTAPKSLFRGLSSVMIKQDENLSKSLFGCKSKQEQTIETLGKNGVTYDDFMESAPEDLEKRLKAFFRNKQQVTAANIGVLREYILKNSIPQW